jgi:hypothetical protein
MGFQYNTPLRILRLTKQVSKDKSIVYFIQEKDIDADNCDWVSHTKQFALKEEGERTLRTEIEIDNGPKITLEPEDTDI